MGVTKMHMKLKTLADFEFLRESIDLECKLAAGRDGSGALPHDFWPTYSSFANTNGGVVLLGVREKKNQFIVEGIMNPSKVRKELFDGINNRQKVSCCLLTDHMVSELVLDRKTVLVVEVPRASRKQHPIHHLTTLNMLESTGGRGAIYYLKGESIPKPEDVFCQSAKNPINSSRHLDESLPVLNSSSPNLDESLPNLNGSLPNLDESSRHLEKQRNKDGCLVSKHLSFPVIDDLALLSNEFRKHLEALASEPRNKKKFNREVLIRVILDICQGQYVTIQSLANLINRHPKTLRDQYLNKLVREQKLQMAFPTTPTHERQAYSTAPVTTQETQKGTQR